MRLTATANGPYFEPIHGGIEESGCLDAVTRLLDRLREQHGHVVRRFVGVVPVWTTSPRFAESCNRTSVRDAFEYARRFRRLRIFLEARVVSSDDGVPHWLNADVDTGRASVAYAVAIARLSLGAALESFAHISASAIAPPTQIPATDAQRAELARLCSDGYFAALWTDAHADYAIDVNSACRSMADAEPHVSLGEPSVRSTTSVSALPNVSAKFERYLSCPSVVDAASRDLLAVLQRSAQSGSRGWDAALQVALKSEGARRIFVLAFQAMLVGMHPQLHPAARPDWSQRALLVRTLVANLAQSDFETVISTCSVAAKESIRLWMCSLLADSPATRAALAHVGHPIGLLRSSPLDLIPAALQGAAQASIAAAIEATTAIASKSPTAVLDSGEGRRLLVAALQARVSGAETRGRSRAPVDGDCGNGGSGSTSTANGAPCTTAVSKAKAHGPRSFAAALTPSWLGRAMSIECPEQPPPSTAPLTALAVVSQLLNRAFRVDFVPVWMHAHGSGVRVSRLDCSQHSVMHGHSAGHQATAQLSDAAALRAQRLALRNPAGSTLSLEQLATLLDYPRDVAVRLAAAKTTDDAVNAVCELSASQGAAMVMFCKVTAMKTRFLAYDLGPRTRSLQLVALRRRFEIGDDVADADVERVLPMHAHTLYTCMECGKVPNACVECNARDISHNEIGVAQSMLRVGSVGEENQVRCARRSSAALRTAQQKEQEAMQARIDCIDVTATTIDTACADNGDAPHAARLRRDVKAVMEQSRHAMACGDRPLVRISLLGRVVRMHGKFYSICAFCASILNVTPHRRFSTEICCGRCDPGVVNLRPAKSQAARVAPKEEIKMLRAAPLVVAAIVPPSKLPCRFCGKAPPLSASSRFRVVRAPLDNSGRNGQLPPPLRTVAFCPSHFRPWVESAMQSLPTAVVFAHISERAVPVFGANGGPRDEPLRLTHRTPARTKAQRAVTRRRTASITTNITKQRAPSKKVTAPAPAASTVGSLG